MLLLTLLSFATNSLLSTFAYIPATPTNDTNFAIAQGLNWSDTSTIQIRWYPRESYSDSVSYQLSANGSNGLTKGALVRFSEANVNETTLPSGTPFIALVNCDTNATAASEEVDIFTLARDMGATAALLYSTHSQACVINAEYTDARYFEQVLDVYTTKNLGSSQLLDDHFKEITVPAGAGLNVSFFKTYDSQRLNSSYEDVISNMNNSNDTISSSNRIPTTQGYLFATLKAYNATADDPTRNGTTTNQPPAKKNSSSHLAMIVLYAITGCVSSLFIAVIISGAIRAIRHPERYGRRRGFASMPHPQGVGQAILDTFPVFKFGSNRPPPPKDMESSEDVSSPSRRGARKAAYDREESPVMVEMDDWRGAPGADSDKLSMEDPGGKDPSNHPAVLPYTGSMRPLSTTYPPGASPEAGPSTPPIPRQQRSYMHAQEAEPDAVPPGIGYDICPICIVDFEEGDDLRMLPCEGKHVFHKACVDPWLLELSSSCPICRHDFLALENMLSRTGETSSLELETEDEEERPPRSRANSGGPSRFSRYVRFATRRHRDREATAAASTTDAPSDQARRTASQG